MSLLHLLGIELNRQKLWDWMRKIVVVRCKYNPPTQYMKSMSIVNAIYSLCFLFGRRQTVQEPFAEIELCIGLSIADCRKSLWRMPMIASSLGQMSAQGKLYCCSASSDWN